MFRTAVLVVLSTSPLSLTVSLLSIWLDRQDREYSVSVEREVPIISAYGSGFPTLVSSAVSTPTVPSFSQRL